MKNVDLRRPTTVQSFNSKNETIDVYSEQRIIIEEEKDGMVMVSIIHDNEELNLNWQNFLKLKIINGRSSAQIL